MLVFLTQVSADDLRANSVTEPKIHLGEERSRSVRCLSFLSGAVRCGFFFQRPVYVLDAPTKASVCCHPSDGDLSSSCLPFQEHRLHVESRCGGAQRRKKSSRQRLAYIVRVCHFRSIQHIDPQTDTRCISNEQGVEHRQQGQLPIQSQEDQTLKWLGTGQQSGQIETRNRTCAVRIPNELNAGARRKEEAGVVGWETPESMVTSMREQGTEVTGNRLNCILLSR